MNYHFRRRYLSPFYSPELFGDRRTVGSAEAGLLAGVASVFAGAVDLVGAGRISDDVLLLSRGVLQSVLGRSAFMRGGGAAKIVLGREFAAADYAERSSVLPLSALMFLCLLALDVWHAMWWLDAATGKEQFGIGSGTLVLAVNVCLLSGYTFGCHSLRHLIGGGRDTLSSRRRATRRTIA